MTNNCGQVIISEMNRLARYINYLIDFDRGYDNYHNQLKENNGISDDVISKSKQTSNAKAEIRELYSKAKKLHNDLKYILQKYKNNLDVNCDLINYGNNLHSANLRIPKTVDLDIPQVSDTGEMTGGASIIDWGKQQCAEFAIGNNYKPEFYILAKSTFGPDTAGMLDLAHEKRNDTSYEKDAIKLTNWNDPRVASDKEYLRGKVIKGFSYYDYDEDNVPGYFFKNYSEPSQRIANDSDFLNKIRENKHKILSNAEDLSVSFTSRNLHNAIGLVDIRNGYLDKNGNLHVKVYDTYDFNPEEDNPLIIAGKNKMLDRELKPFFTIHDIIIPKEKLDELWE